MFDELYGGMIIMVSIIWSCTSAKLTRKTGQSRHVGGAQRLEQGQIIVVTWGGRLVSILSSRGRYKRWAQSGGDITSNN